MQYYIQSELKKQANIAFLSPESVKKVSDFHKSFPQYSVTPLVRLDSLAKELGVKSIEVKDESKRFGLNAFKVLGGSYAIGRILSEKLGISETEMSFEKLSAPESREKLGDLTFVTATDGNHGRGVAWTAETLGFNAIVFMPKGTAKERLDNILITGADASITELIYDDAVRLAKKTAEEKGGILVQDTAWEGYTDIPEYIMQGYTTLAAEIVDSPDYLRPTHIFVQAGVGSMAAAVVGFFANALNDNPPVMIVTEPDSAACIYETAKAEDGKMHFITEMNTIQAGLACGEPCTTAMDILKNNAKAFVTIPDCVAAEGMRRLASPKGSDKAITAGESGAAGFGTALEILVNQPELKEKLGIDENSVILCVNTEGDTDKENYKKIVFENAYPRY